MNSFALTTTHTRVTSSHTSDEEAIGPTALPPKQPCSRWFGGRKPLSYPRCEINRPRNRPRQGPEPPPPWTTRGSPGAPRATNREITTDAAEPPCKQPLPNASRQDPGSTNTSLSPPGASRPREASKNCGWIGGIAGGRRHGSGAMPSPHSDSSGSSRPGGIHGETVSRPGQHHKRGGIPTALPAWCSHECAPEALLRSTTGAFPERYHGPRFRHKPGNPEPNPDPDPDPIAPSNILNVATPLHSTLRPPARRTRERTLAAGRGSPLGEEANDGIRQELRHDT